MRRIAIALGPAGRRSLTGSRGAILAVLGSCLLALVLYLAAPAPALTGQAADREESSGSPGGGGGPEKKDEPSSPDQGSGGGPEKECKEAKGGGGGAEKKDCPDSSEEGSGSPTEQKEQKGDSEGAGLGSEGTKKDAGKGPSPRGGGGGGGPAGPPPPQPARTVNVEAVEGTVQVKLKGSDSFATLTDSTQIPVGSTVDVSDGSVNLTSAAVPGRTQSAIFFGGAFTVLQRPGVKPLTVLELAGGNFGRCGAPGGTGGTARASRGRGAARRVVRRLWGKGRGLFLTRGRYSSASVRGTTWLTEDRCDGTFTRARSGRVRVCDFSLRRAFVLRAGQSHLARPSLRKLSIRRSPC